jgi:hypothetical protein
MLTNVNDTCIMYHTIHIIVNTPEASADGREGAQFEHPQHFIGIVYASEG